jgi:hypothetical protein
MYEIGVQNGGSAQMWRQFLGPSSIIVGIDINPACRHVADNQIYVKIGDQSDAGFLTAIVEEFGPPDIVIDDGSHKMEHINASFDFLFPLMPKNSIYMVEDLHTAYWEEYGGGAHSEVSFINRAKGFVDQLNAHYSRGQVPVTDFNRTVTSVHFYDSLVCIEKNTPPRGTSMIGQEGQVWDPRQHA